MAAVSCVITVPEHWQERGDNRQERGQQRKCAEGRKASGHRDSVKLQAYSVPEWDKAEGATTK